MSTLTLSCLETIHWKKKLKFSFKLFKLSVYNNKIRSIYYAIFCFMKMCVQFYDWQNFTKYIKYLKLL